MQGRGSRPGALPWQIPADHEAAVAWCRISQSRDDRPGLVITCGRARPARAGPRRTAAAARRGGRLRRDGAWCAGRTSGPQCAVHMRGHPGQAFGYSGCPRGRSSSSRCRRRCRRARYGRRRGGPIHRGGYRRRTLGRLSTSSRGSAIFSLIWACRPPLASVLATTSPFRTTSSEPSGKMLRAAAWIPTVPGTAAVPHPTAAARQSRPRAHQPSSRRPRPARPRRRIRHHRPPGRQRLDLPLPPRRRSRRLTRPAPPHTLTPASKCRPGARPSTRITRPKATPITSLTTDGRRSSLGRPGRAGRRAFSLTYLLLHSTRRRWPGPPDRRLSTVWLGGSRRSWRALYAAIEGVHIVRPGIMRPCRR
jgi:hypothetical protein